MTMHGFSLGFGVGGPSLWSAKLAAFEGVLDVAGVSAEAAYSLRKLRSGYSGSAVRVRREIDNAEVDIGFLANGDFDEDSLIAFADTDGVFVVTWYDQSGNAYDSSQATAGAQPLISFDGSMSTLGSNARGVISYSGSAFTTRASTTLTMSSFNAVSQPDSFSTSRAICDHNNNTSGTRWYFRFQATSGMPNFTKSTSLMVGALSTAAQVISGVSSNGANSQLWRNGTSLGTGPTLTSGATSGTFHIGASPLGGNYFSGLMTEILIFATNLTTTQRQAIERNQGTYYGITVA